MIKPSASLRASWTRSIRVPSLLDWRSRTEAPHCLARSLHRPSMSERVSPAVWPAGIQPVEIGVWAVQDINLQRVRHPRVRALFSRAGKEVDEEAGLHRRGKMRCPLEREPNILSRVDDKPARQ